MGRPLNKKYFANRNIGSASVTTDDGIGGQGVLSVTLDALGAYTTRPTVTFGLPQLPGSVRATGTVSSQAKSAVVTVGGTGYEVGDLLTATTNGGTAVFEVATLAGDGSTGEVATVTIDDAGLFTSLSAGAQATTTDGLGEDCTLTVTYEAAEVVITESGSGYTSAPTATFTQSVTASAVNLTTDTGSAGSATNQENGIIANAFIPAADGGTQALSADIVKQVNDRAYKVKTSEGVGICKLVTDNAANAAGEMTITATDGSGKTYYVAKITSRKAVLVPYGAAGHEFPLNSDGTAKSVKWSFGAASTANKVVQIENA